MISLTSPVETKAHDWPAGLKLAGLCVASVALFALTDPWAHMAALVAVLALYALPGRVFMRAGLSRLTILWPFVAIVAIWHLVIGDWLGGFVIVCRMVTAVALANLVTMTTRLADMIEVARRLLSPLRYIGLGGAGAALEIAAALAIRFTPVLIGKGQALGEAWRARSPRRPGWRVVLPFTLLALDDADRVAEALKARGGVQTDRSEARIG